jgi:hypothetical protein
LFPGSVSSCACRNRSGCHQCRWNGRHGTSISLFVICFSCVAVVVALHSYEFKWGVLGRDSVSLLAARLSSRYQQSTAGGALCFPLLHYPKRTSVWLVFSAFAWVFLWRESHHSVLPSARTFGMVTLTQIAVDRFDSQLLSDAGIRGCRFDEFGRLRLPNDRSMTRGDGTSTS